MGRTSVRNAVRSYLTGSVIPNLQVVHKAKPRNWPASDFRTIGGAGSAASAWVYVESSVETRETTGKKSVSYVVSVQFLFRSQKTDVDAAEQDLDDLIDAIKARLRRKDTNGFPSPLGVNDGSIFQAAEDLLEDATDMTRDDTMQPSVRGFVRFDVKEWFNA